MATYEEYLDDLLERASKQQAVYEAERTKQAQQAAASVDEAYNTAIRQADQAYARSVEQTRRSYRDVYDANVVDELVARRHASEAIANANLMNSGLNATQQTAISLSRSRADHTTTQQQQEAVNAIMRELDNVRTQYQQQAASEKASIYNAADADVLNYQQALQKNAQTDAATLYKADVAAAQAAIDAPQKDTKTGKSISEEEDVAESKVLGVKTPTGEINPYITSTGHASNYGMMTANDSGYESAWEAGKQKVYQSALALWNAHAWGDPNNYEARQALEKYLSLMYDQGQIKDAETAAKIRKAIVENKPLT